jgi:hypothetical protein
MVTTRTNVRSHKVGGGCKPRVEKPTARQPVIVLIDPTAAIRYRQSLINKGLITPVKGT